MGRVGGSGGGWSVSFPPTDKERKLKVGDKVRIKSKSISPIPTGLWVEFLRNRHHGGTDYITRIKGDPYGGQNDKNCFVIGGDFFAPQDLELIEPVEKIRPAESEQAEQERIFKTEQVRTVSGKMENPQELKVGDEIIVTNGSGAGFQGKVIAINPTPNLMNPYVVELFGCQAGEKSPDSYSKILNSKTLPSSCIFKSASELALLSDLDREVEKRDSSEVKKIITPEKKAGTILFWYLDEILGKKGDYPLLSHRAIEVEVENLAQLLSEETTHSARMAIRELGTFLYEMLTGHSERTDISFRLDGYPAIQVYNPDISDKFSQIIQQMISGDFREPETLKKAFESQTPEPKQENPISSKEEYDKIYAKIA